MRGDKKLPMTQTALTVQTHAGSRVLDYHANLAANRDVFLLNYGQELALFEETISILDDLMRVVGDGRDAQGHTHVGLLPFLMLMVRQAFNAFEAFSNYQSYQAWTSLRPFLESALMIGKWMDDPKNAHIWRDRDKNRKAYNDTYWEQNIISKSLANCEVIRSALTRINEQFMHANYQYFSKHLQDHKDESGIWRLMRFVDYEDEHRTHFYAFLHLTRFTTDSIATTLGKKIHGAARVNTKLTDLQQSLKDKVIDLAKSNREAKVVLRAFGLWPANLLSASQNT
jgi:hypothetical protein